MKETYIALATVAWYIDAERIEENIVMTGVESFTDAARKLEEYYGIDLEKYSITLVEGPFLQVSSRYLEAIEKDEHLNI